MTIRVTNRRIVLVLLIAVASLQFCRAQSNMGRTVSDVPQIPTSTLWSWAVGTDTTIYYNSTIVNYRVTARDTIYRNLDVPQRHVAYTTPLWLRTNLLLPLMNVGVEVPIGNRWSVAADWYYPWIPRLSNDSQDGSSHKNCFQIDGIVIEGRYWLGNKHRKNDENKQYRLTGHSIGLFFMGGRYDLERNYKGHQGEYILGGFDYLYAKPVFGGRLRLELSLGIGYLYSRATKYEVFVREGKGYRDKNFRKNISYFGPLRAGVTLAVPIKIRVNR